MSAQDKAVCERILTLSKLNGVEPLPVVALLSVHALVDMDFKLLRVWIRVGDAIREMLDTQEWATT